jgi:hypothetical protein
MDGGGQGVAFVPIGVDVRQQISAAVLQELTQGPRFLVPAPLDRIDPITLVMETVLHSIERLGIGGSSTDYALEGATKDDLIFFMAERVAGQIEFFGLGPVPPLDINLYCAKLMDQLLRQGPNAPPPDRRAVALFGRPKPLRFELFRERYGANGSDVVVIASEYATNAIFQCLSNDITDTVAANQYMIGLQLQRKEYGRMASHLRQQIRIAQSFHAEILQLLNRVRYEIRQTSWGGDLSGVVQRVRRQADDVIEQDGTIRHGLIAAISLATNEDRPRLWEIDGLGSAAFSRHAAINGDVTRLHEEFLENKSIRAMRQPSAMLLRDHEDDILLPLLRSHEGALGAAPMLALDLLLKPELPTSNDPVHWLSQLLTFRQTGDDGAGEDEDADYDEAVEVEDEAGFSEADEVEVDRRLLDFAIDTGRPFLLSEFLTWFGRQGATDAQIHLACLFVSTIFMHRSRRYAVGAMAEREGPLIAGPLFGTDFRIELLDPNEENYTRDADRSE